MLLLECSDLKLLDYPLGAEMLASSVRIFHGITAEGCRVVALMLTGNELRHFCMNLLKERLNRGLAKYLYFWDFKEGCVKEGLDR